MGKRIFVLGGAGNLGSECAKDLLFSDEVEEVAIGDFDVDKARVLAKELNDKRVKFVETDVTDEDEAARKVEGYDVLMNCTFFGLFSHALDVAIKAHVDYADLTSEPNEKQRRAVKEAGITAVAGIGLIPGLGNILARDAADSVDETEAIEISWIALRTVAPSPGLLETVFWYLSPECKKRQHYVSGRFMETGPFEGSKIVRFPEPVGEQVVYFGPDSGNVTLPKHIQGVKYVAVRGGWRQKIMEDFMVLNKYGLMDNVEVNYKGAGVNVCDFVKEAVWRKLGGRVDYDCAANFLKVEVTGRRGEKYLKRTYNVTHPLEWGDRATAKMSGIPASVGAILLARHRRKITGIVDPEQFYDPKEFLRELDKRGTIKVEWVEEVIEEVK